MSTISITLQEKITNPSGEVNYINHFQEITGVNQIFNFTDIISNKPLGDGVEILRFVDDENHQTAGSMVRDKVKYIRLTNKNPNYSCDITLVRESDNKTVVLEIQPQSHLLLPSTDFNFSDINDYVEEGYVDMQYYANFDKLKSIKARANFEPIELQYIIASS